MSGRTRLPAGEPSKASQRHTRRGEPLPGGEMGRRMAPPGPLRDAGLGAAFLAQAAGKRMLAVDIRKPEGAEILRRLLRNADVFVEGLRPGAVAGQL